MVIGASALSKHVVTPAELSELLEQSSRQHNIAAARRAVARMNGLSESAGESLSRLRMEQHGMPTPALQYEVPVLGFRVDFFWPQCRLIREFDGMGKYGGNFREPRSREGA